MKMTIFVFLFGLLASSAHAQVASNGMGFPNEVVPISFLEGDYSPNFSESDDNRLFEDSIPDYLEMYIHMILKSETNLYLQHIDATAGGKVSIKEGSIDLDYSRKWYTSQFNRTDGTFVICGLTKGNLIIGFRDLDTKEIRIWLSDGLEFSYDNKEYCIFSNGKWRLKKS